MSSYNISNRYANALLRQVEETENFDKVAEDIDLVYNTLSDAKDLRMALASPIISDSKKKSILQEIFKDRISKETENFILFIVTKNREEFLFDISKRFLELRDDKQNRVNALVTTAFDLADNEKKLFETQLTDYTNKQVRLTFKVDDGIIGGFLVKIKDHLLDASVIHQLELLRKKLIRDDQTLVN